MDERLRSPDTTRIDARRDLHGADGPFATVYVDTRATSVEELLPRWRAVQADPAEPAGRPRDGSGALCGFP
ncbi:hypothetical protein ACL02T_08605 [Pseudonocardia sp. RS010]|uniref:hypothetical protein n=1 Tax=Pseudonocardia sp. RS010 TaxID=3385979 RepID=UPI0039A265CE